MLRLKNKMVCDAHEMLINALEGGRMELVVSILGNWKSKDMNVTQKRHNEMLANFVKEGRDLLFDFDHNSLWAESIAAGWGKNLRIDDDKLIVEFEPTPMGKERIDNHEYKYLSPVYLLKQIDRVSGKITNDWKLESVALTNTPFIHELPAIKNNEIDGGIVMDELLKMLGADDEASAIEKVKELIANTLTLKAEKDDLSVKINSQEVEQAIAEKKLLPAQKDLAIKLINTDRSLYDELVKHSGAAGLTAEVVIEGQANDGLDPFAHVNSFSDLLKDPALCTKMEAEAPERYNALYNTHMKGGK